MTIKSWTNEEELSMLAEKSRFGEIVTGVVRSVAMMKVPVVRSNGDTEFVEEETMNVALPGGVTGYCPASEFRERDFKTLRRFVNTKQQFLITKIDLDNKMAILSEKQAAEKTRSVFWEEIKGLSESEQLQDKVYEGTVSGYNQDKGIIYVRIQGQDCYMFRNDWQWTQTRRPIIDAQAGETIQVKIIRFDEEAKVVQVSRKATQPDPFDYLTTLKINTTIAGRVERVDPIHGLFVKVEEGVVLKAGKISALEEPAVGDFVTCVVKRISPEERRGKVVITDYPRGKRKRQDLGSFLFE